MHTVLLFTSVSSLEYDPTVKKSIPLNKFTLFKPLLDAVGVVKSDNGNLSILKERALMNRGAIIVGITESRAVPKRITAGLTKVLESCEGVKIVEIPRYSLLEVEHILANFEATGVGRLRFDRGATVMDAQEVAFLKMLSDGVGQKLLDSCII